MHLPTTASQRNLGIMQRPRPQVKMIMLPPLASRRTCPCHLRWYPHLYPLGERSRSPHYRGSSLSQKTLSPPDLTPQNVRPLLKQIDPQICPPGPICPQDQRFITWLKRKMRDQKEVLILQVKE